MSSINRGIPKVKVVPQFIPFTGGLDTDTPILMTKPGYLRGSINVYEGITGGYWTAPPYEAFDGQSAPSAQTYTLVPITITGTIAPGDVLDQPVGGATASATVLAVAAGYVIVTAQTGTWVDGLAYVGAVEVGTIDADGVIIDGGSTPALQAQYRALAADYQRAFIEAIPGSGPVRGIWYYDQAYYGIRNNAGGTAMAMYKSTTAGWTLVPLGYELSFTSGGGGAGEAIEEGQTLVGATSGFSFVVTRVIVNSGSFGAGTAAGRLILASKTGALVAENLNKTLPLPVVNNICAIAGDATAITFANPSGRCEFINTNFTGNTDTIRMYGCDGVNRAFEFDGTVFVPLNTGMEATTYPSHIIEHKYHLFLAFGSSVQHSVVGDPYNWVLWMGADEIGMSDFITGFVSMPGTETSATLAVLNRNSIGILYGSVHDDFSLQLYKNGVGAIEWTAQFIGSTFMLDDRGIMDIKASMVYGNFTDASVSQHVSKYMTTKKPQVLASAVSAEHNLYMISFNDNTAIFCTINGGKMKAICPMHFPNKMQVICAAEDQTGDERIMFGDENGFVHELYRGLNFNGVAIDWSMYLVPDFFKSPTTTKRYRKARFEVGGEGYAEFHFSYQLGYTADSFPQPGTESDILELISSNWDDGGTWDSGSWDAVELLPSEFDMMGSETNVILQLTGSGRYFSPMHFSAAIIQYTPTREIR